MRRLRYALLPIVAAAVLGFSCGGDDVTGPAVEVVDVSITSPSIFVGQTTTVTATLKDAGGSTITGREVAWLSSAAAVATVSATGLVTGVGAGTATITASSGGRSGTVSLTVVAPVASVTLTLGSASILAGSTTQATATPKDASGATLSGRTVTWSSATTAVATVNGSGLVTGVSPGNSVITATSEGKTGSATITVTGNPPGAFQLVLPTNRSAGVSTAPSFSWQAASGAASYTIEVATASSFGSTNVITQAGLTSTNYTPTSALQAGVVYFWRVTAVNTSGSTVASNATFEFSAPIPVGSSPGQVGVTPDGARALVVNSTSPGTVTLVTLATRQIAGTITVGPYPNGLAIRPDGAQAVVANSNSLSVINLSTGAVSSTIAMPCVATTLYDIAYTPDGLKVVFPDLSNGCTQSHLRIVTLATAAQVSVNLNTNAVPIGVAVMPNGNSALVTLGVTGTSMRRVDLSSLAVTTIAGTSSTYGVAVLPDNSAAIVNSGPSETIKRITLSTNTVSNVVAFDGGTYWHGLALTPDGTKAVVVGDFATAVISLATNTVVATFPSGGSGVAVTPDGKYALVTSLSSGSPGSGVLRVMRIP
jgi:DNA-binding beta-propeller fold protein YncE